MLTHHSAELFAKFDELSEFGVTTITPTKLLLWYDRDRITVAIWRDLAVKWSSYLEDSEDEGTPLLVGENEGSYALVWGAGLTTDDSYFELLEDLAHPKDKDKSEDE
jgi:hypothetical protein